jgi:hypothetical protein
LLLNYLPKLLQVSFFLIQALHPLLEDGCPDDEEFEEYKKV